MMMMMMMRMMMMMISQGVLLSLRHFVCFLFFLFFCRCDWWKKLSDVSSLFGVHWIPRFVLCNWSKHESRCQLNSIYKPFSRFVTVQKHACPLFIIQYLFTLRGPALVIASHQKIWALSRCEMLSASETVAHSNETRADSKQHVTCVYRTSMMNSSDSTLYVVLTWHVTDRWHTNSWWGCRGRCYCCWW